KKFVWLSFSHNQSYLYSFSLLFLSPLLNGSCPVNTIAPLSFITLSYCSHNGSKGMIVSHEHAVVSYGKSHKIMSTDLSGIRFIPSRQSSLYILFNSICSTLFSYLTFRISLFVCLLHDCLCVRLMLYNILHLTQNLYSFYLY